jgi:hypothetical protein
MRLDLDAVVFTADQDGLLEHVVTGHDAVALRRLRRGRPSGGNGRPSSR